MNFIGWIIIVIFGIWLVVLFPWLLIIGLIFFGIALASWRS